MIVDCLSYLDLLDPSLLDHHRLVCHVLGVEDLDALAVALWQQKLVGPALHTGDEGAADLGRYVG
jgi:hypothetical protein